MRDKERLVTWRHYIGVLLFSILTVSTVLISYIGIASLYSQLNPLFTTVIFEKGNFYMVGVSLSFAAFVVAVIIENWYPSLFSESFVRYITRVMIGGIFLMILLPQIVHLSLSNYLEQQGYERCHNRAISLSRYKAITYAKNQIVCNEIDPLRTIKE